MDASRRLRPQVILLGLVSLMNDAASEMIYPLLPVFLSTTLGATPLVIGMIEGAADAVASLLKLVAGAWSDRLRHRRPLIGSGYLLAAVSRGLIAIASAWPMVLAARLLDRTGKGIRSAPRDALIADVTPEDQRGKAFGFHRALDHTGAIVGPLLAMMLLGVFQLPLRTVFALAVIPGIIGVAMIVFLLREPAREPRVRAVGLAEPARLPRRFWAAVGAVATFSLANSSDAFLILQAHAAGVSTAMLPALWAAHHVLKSAFSTLAGSISDRTSRTSLLVVGWLSYAVIYAIFPHAKSTTFFFVLFVAYATPFLLTEGAERAWIVSFAPPELRGRSFGYYYLANGICVLAGTAIFGTIYQRVSPEAAFYAGAGIAMIAALAAALAGRGERAVSS